MRRGLEILNKSKVPVFEIDDEGEVAEELRLTYRYLDLRREKVMKALTLRHKLCSVVRNFLSEQKFVEVETPVLTKSTPEGARDYLVPSRVNAGKFYALPQSPQLFKQLLMVAGMDRYYQIVKCFRDEDLRADRQPEFTQIDMELSFVNEEDIFRITEGMISHVMQQTLDYGLPLPLPRMSYDEAMDRFGTDRPDLRFGLELVNLTEVVKDCGFQVFKTVVQNKGLIKSINAKGCASFSRKDLDDLTGYFGAHRGLATGGYIAGSIQNRTAYSSGHFPDGCDAHLSSRRTPNRSPNDDGGKHHQEESSDPKPSLGSRCFPIAVVDAQLIELIGWVYHLHFLHFAVSRLLART